MVVTRWRTAVSTVFALLVAGSAAPQVPVGSEFRVDTGGAPPAASGTARAAMLSPDRSFVVTWVTEGAAPRDSDVMARRFDPSGSPIGAEFLVNSFTTGEQYDPEIASDDAGSFVVVWTSVGQDGAGQGVFGQRFDASGTAVGAEFLVNTVTANGQWYPSVAMRSTGAFVVAWTDTDPARTSPYAQRYDAAGLPLGGEFAVADASLACGRPRTTAMDFDDAGIVSAWGSHPVCPTGSWWVIDSRRFDAGGAPQGVQSWVNDVPAERPRVSSRPDGAFVVVYGAHSGSVGARRFDGDGNPVALPFVVSQQPASSASAPDIHTDGDGAFVVVWETAQDGDLEGISVRQFDPAGTGGAELPVNANVAGRQIHPTVAGARSGDFLVIWHSNHEGPWTIRARRYAGSVADVAISIASSPANIVRGTTFSYSMVVTNDGPDPALAVEADFETPPGLTFLSNSGDCTSPFPCALGTLASGAARSVVSTFRMPPDYGGPNPIVATMTAASTTIDLDASNNTATTQATLAPDEADLSIVKVGPSVTSSGWDVVYALTVENHGPSHAAGVRVDDAPPPGLVFLSNAGACSTPFPCLLGSVPVGETRVIQATFAVPPDYPGPAPIVNHAMVRTLTVDPDWTNDTAAATTDWVPPALVATAIAVDAGGNGVLQPNEAATVAVSWSNVGPVEVRNAAGAVFIFSGPPSAAYTVLDGRSTYGTIAPGATASCGADCFGIEIAAASRPAPHWDAIFVEAVTPGLTNRQWPLHVGDSFTDVRDTSPFYRFVETILHHAVTTGCSATTYCPTAAATREQMAVFVLTAKEGAGYVPPACATPVFADVPAGSPYCRWIEELARRGVVGGCGGGNYCPASSVAREQMAVFVLRTLDPALAPPPCATPLFTDVPASSPFCRWIEELARRGIVSGCGGGAYCPTAPVTREQMAVFLSVTFALSLYGP